MIVLTGMHRSGTSAYAKIAYEMGLEMGGVDRMENHDDGHEFCHYENHQANRINEALIQSMHDSTWQDIREVNVGFNIVIPPEIDRALKGFDVSVVKDPRFLITYNIWTQYHPISKVVMILRNMPDIIKSLKKRHGWSDEKWFILIIRYYKGLEGMLKMGIPVHFADYDALMDEPEPEIRAMADFLEVKDYDIDKVVECVKPKRRLAIV